MNNYYTATIPPTLAEKLKEKGCEHPYAIPEQWEYGFVFDWLMEKGLFVVVEPYWDFANETITKDFEASVIKQGTIHTPTPIVEGNSWHEAANAAIEKALTLI